MASSCSVLGVPGDGHDDVLAALGGDLGLGDAVGVDALADDVDGLVDLARAHLLAVLQHRLEDHLGAALEVETEAGGRGAAAPAREAGGEGAEAEDDDEQRQQVPDRGLLRVRACHESLTDLTVTSPGSCRGSGRCRRRRCGSPWSRWHRWRRRVGLLHRDGATVDADRHAVSDLEPAAGVVEVLDRAEDAGGRDHLVADVERRC